MAEELELLIKIKTEGQQKLDQIANSMRAISGQVAPAKDAFGALDSQISKTKGHLDDLAKGNAKVKDSFQDLGARIRGSLTNPIGEAGAGIEALLSSFGKMGVVTTAVGAGVALLGKQAVDLVRDLGKAAEQTINFADRLGITVGQAERLRAAADITGVDIGTLEGSTRLLAAALEDSTGAGAKAATALRTLGVSVYTATGEQREMGVVMLEVLDRLSKVGNTAERTKLATDILGRGAKELQPLVKNLDEVNGQVQALGIGLDEGLTKRLANADNAFDLFRLRVAQIKKELAAPFDSPLSNFLMWMATANSPIRALLEPHEDQPWMEKKQTKFDIQTGIRVLTPEQALVEDWQKSRAGTEEGQKQRIEALKKQMAELSTMLSSGNLNTETFAQKRAEFEKLESETRTLEAQIKSATERQSLIASLPNLLKQSRLAGLTALERLNVEQEDLLKRLGPGFDAQVAEIFRNPRQAELQKILGENRERLAKDVKESEETTGKLLEWGAKQFTDDLKRRIDADQKAVDSLKQRLDAIGQADIDRAKVRARRDQRIIELSTDSGGELAAANATYARRLQLAQELYDLAKRQAEIEEDADQRELALTKARGDYEREIDEARVDRELSLWELRKKHLDEYREAAGRVFDALTASGGGGLRDYFAAQLKTLERQIFVNLSGEIFKQVGGTLGDVIPGQRDSQGKPTLLGRILSGTIFGKQDDPLKTATDLNTQATTANTLAITSLSRALATGQVVGGSDGAALGGGVLDAAIDLAGGSTQAGATKQNWLQRNQKLIGGIAAGAAGAYGVYSGIQQGGARGATTAAGSAAGAAGTILTLAGVTGPAAPILAGVGMALGFVTSLFGDPKKERDEAITKMLSDARYKEPTSVERTYNLAGGGDVDYDYRGRVRVVNRYNVTVPVQAMDAKGFLERSDDICKAVRKGIQDGGGSGLSDQIRYVVGVNQ